jgi:hypothetical protein
VLSNEKYFNYKVLGVVEQYNFKKGVTIKDCLKYLKIWISKYEELKQICEILSNFNSKTYQQQIIDWIGHYNFGINHVNIQSGVKILNFKSKNWKRVFGAYHKPFHLNL